MHISFAVRPSSFFVHRLLSLVGMPGIAAGDHFAGRMANPVRRVALGPEFHADLEFWRWFVDEVVDARDGVLSAPMYHLLERPARRTLFSDASKIAVRGYCLETGVYWRYDLTAQEQSRFCGSSTYVRGVDDLSVNVLERLGMVVSAFFLVSSCADRPSATGDCALLRGGNDAAVNWVRRCRGGAGIAFPCFHASPRRSLSVIRMAFRGNACAWCPHRCRRRYLSLRSRLRS